jgi:integrase
MNGVAVAQVMAAYQRPTLIPWRSIMPVVKMTQHYITHQLQCPAGKPKVELCDASLPGLYVLVVAGSTTFTFFLRHKDSTGKTCHAKIGRTSDITLADARKRALELKAEFAAARISDKREEAKPSILTFSAFFVDHYLPHVKGHKRSWEKDEGIYRLRLKAEFGDLPLDQITRQNVQAFHTTLKTTGLAAATCDHHIKLLRHALNLAVEWGKLEQNPIERLHLFNEDNKVENYLDDAEMERLLSVLTSRPQFPTCQIALFLLSTGARLNEALQAKWTQIDRENRVWRIPASNSKSKRIRSIPLNDSALELLGQLDTEDKFEYLFINRKTGVPPVYIQKYWERVRIDAKLPKLRLHDLRHQYASMLINSGRSLYEVQNILGHSDPKVTQRYAHLSTKSLQDAANSASVMIQKSMKPA